MAHQDALGQTNDMVKTLMHECVAFLTSDTGLSEAGEAQLVQSVELLKAEREKLALATALVDNSIQVLETAIKRSANHHNSSTAQLPPEILSKIFETAYPIWTPKRRRRSIEMILPQVCSQWRNVALGLPTLWTNIDTSAKLRLLGHLQGYLDRSGNRLLSVCLDLRDASVVTSMLAWPRLVEHTHRWQRLVIKINSPMGLGKVYELLRDLAAHRLEDFHVLSCSKKVGHFDDPTHFDMPSIFCQGSGSPILKYMRIHGPYRPPFWFQLSTITTLYVDTAKQMWSWNEDFYPLISALTSLENLSIFHDPLSQTLSSNNLQLVLPTLRSLRLRANNDNCCYYYGNLLEYLIAPSLQLLHLVDWDHAIVHFLDEYNTSLNTTPDGSLRFPELQSLILDRCNFSSLRSLTDSFPSLKFLTCVGHAAISCAEPMLKNPGFWMNLEAVYFCDNPSSATTSLGWLPQTPKVFYANQASYSNMIRESNFMHFLLEFSNWRELQGRGSAYA